MVKQSAVETHVQTLEEIRDMLLRETPQQGESADKRSGFVNGVLDMYNLMKNRQDKLLEMKWGGDMNVIVPLNKKVVVMPEEKEKVSAGGIVIPETANQKAPTKGTVIAIADDSDLKLKISPGDIILFSKYAGADVVIPGAKVGEKSQTILIIKDEDILAVIEHRDNKK